MNSALSGKAGASCRTRSGNQKRRVREDTPPQALSAEFIPPHTPAEWELNAKIERAIAGWFERQPQATLTPTNKFDALSAASDTPGRLKVDALLFAARLREQQQNVVQTYVYTLHATF